MLIVVLAVLIVGGTFYYLYRRKKQQVAAAASWPSVEGRITASAVLSERERNSSGNFELRYTPRISYEYAVDGTSYAGDRVRFGLLNLAHEKASKDICARYPLGSTATIYYNPANPSESVLERGV